MGTMTTAELNYEYIHRLNLLIADAELDMWKLSDRTEAYDEEFYSRYHALQADRLQLRAKLRDAQG